MSCHASLGETGITQDVNVTILGIMTAAVEGITVLAAVASGWIEGDDATIGANDGLFRGSGNCEGAAHINADVDDDDLPEAISDDEEEDVSMEGADAGAGSGAGAGGAMGGSSTG